MEKSKAFSMEVLKRRIAFYESVPENSVAFADRGIPDQLAFARYHGFVAPEVLVQGALNYRYSPQVFVTPPWPEIFVNDAIRTETYEEAVRIHQSVIDTYSDLNYQLIELPLLSVAQRVKFLLQILQTKSGNSFSIY